MPRRSSYRAPLRQGQRRQTQWIGSVDETAFISVGAGNIDFQGLLGAGALALRPFTVVRVRGMLSLISDQVAAAEEPFGAWGLCVVTEQASAAGTASLPSPISEDFSDVWFAYQFGAAPINSAGVMASVATSYFDSRAMRKVEEGQDIVSLFENAHATHGLKYVVKYRMLVKLH